MTTQLIRKAQLIHLRIAPPELLHLKDFTKNFETDQDISFRTATTKAS
jgi:hypothetical protein